MSEGLTVAQVAGHYVLMRTKELREPLKNVESYVYPAIKSGDVEMLRAYDDCYSTVHSLSDINHAVELLRYHEVTGVRLTPDHLQSYFEMKKFLISYALLGRTVGYHLATEQKHGIMFLALTHPQHLEIFHELVTQRHMNDPQSILELAEDIASGPSSLSEGTL